LINRSYRLLASYLLARCRLRSPTPFIVRFIQGPGRKAFWVDGVRRCAFAPGGGGIRGLCGRAGRRWPGCWVRSHVSVLGS
jgi:hypothetical protein